VARQVHPAAPGASAAPVAQAPPAVCTLSGWRAVPLATQAGAPRYAVFSGEDELALLPGAAHALVSAERGGLTLRGWVALADFPVSIKRELVVDGYLVSVIAKFDGALVRKIEPRFRSWGGRGRAGRRAGAARARGVTPRDFRE
jgi:hypothetical protein